MVVYGQYPHKKEQKIFMKNERDQKGGGYYQKGDVFFHTAIVREKWLLRNIMSMAVRG